MITRRDFVRTAVIGSGMLLIWSIMPGTALAASGSRKVRFTVKKGTRGCSLCGRMVKKMLADKQKRAKLEELFPENSTVVFYVRRPKSRTKVAENAIAVGVCARTLKSKSDVYVKGCRRQINPDLIYNTIIKTLKKSE
jgi:hypothetical protein